MRGPACLFYNAVRHQLNSRHLLKALLRKGIGYTGFHALEIRCLQLLDLLLRERGLQRLAVHERRPPTRMMFCSASRIQRLIGEAEVLNRHQAFQYRARTNCL